MSTKGLNPYDIFSLAVGPARVLYAPTTAPVPTKLQDIVALVNDEGAYDPADEWLDFGAAPEGNGASYTRGFDTESLGIEQTTGAVFTDITDVNRGISLDVAEINPANLSIIEGTDADPATIAKAKGSSAQTAVLLGSVSEFPSFRVALIGQRKKDSGIVKEPDLTERGRLVAVVLNRCTITADDSEIQVQKGSLVSAALQLEAFPEPGVTAGAFGRWLFEEAGAIEAAA